MHLYAFQSFSKTFTYLYVHGLTDTEWMGKTQ